MQDDCLEQLRNLVLLFSANITQYKNSQYDEANTRTDFIDKFFSLLDWDIANNQGYSESYREVVREDKVKIDGSHKAPDYSFRIGGLRKFFVEAKKPGINIKDAAEPAYQVRRYAYTARLSLSILTNFAEFSVYDTRIKPNKDDKAGTARIFYCTFGEYEQHFEFIRDTFSKNAILKGSFDKYVEANKNKKGTSEVDAELLALVEEWRMELAKNIAKNNPELSVYNLNTVVQRIIDRIIFIRIAEDKGIEDDKLLLTVAKTSNIYEKLILLFTRANVKYNSGLFADIDWINNVRIEDKVLSNIIVNLYYPECPYEFSVLPIEILGSIYERFLGKTIRFRSVKGDARTAIIEEKPEVKKAGGVFYTPQYIVDYIVQNTVGEKIKNKTPEEIAGIKICDPACGSGSFLVGAYQYLLNYHLDYYTQPKNVKSALKNAKIYEAAFQSYKLTIEEKQRILAGSIYGVDIDSQAVEVTKLSLYLKLLENEGKEAEGWLFKYSDKTLLPALEDNIKCGNSLIGTDFYAQPDLALTDDDRIKINCFDWEKEFPVIFKNGGVDGGFDVVIGNPPYVRIHEISFNEKKHYENNYISASNQFDLYQLFYEKGLNLLNNEGILGFITSNKFCITRYGKVLREHIFDNYKVFSITDVSNLNIFRGASTYPYIFIIKNSKQTKNMVNISLVDYVFNNNLVFSLSYKKIQSELLTGNERILSLNCDKEKSNLLLKIENVSILNSLSVYRGRGTSKDLSVKKVKNSVVSITNKQINRFVLNDEIFYRDKFSFVNDFEPKLLMKKICYTIDVAIDEKGNINPINTVYVIKPKNNLISLKFLLAILCSKLITFYTRTKYHATHMRGGYIELRVFEVETLPIPALDISKKTDKTKHDNLVSLVDKMLELKQKETAEQNQQLKTMISRQIEGLDNAIDKAVYGLYNLTEDEVKMLEGG
jgi:adenine-specific DNA-methyltransferase